MGYSFGAGQATHKIACGAVPAVTTFSVGARFKINAANSTIRTLVGFSNALGDRENLFFGFDNGGTNRAFLEFSKGNGTGFPRLTWTSGFTAGSIHAMVGTYDLNNLRLYADADATAKATLAETGSPDAGNTFNHGNFETTSFSLDGVLYEVGFWPGIVLTGAQAAFFGAGYDAAYLFAPHHWRLRTHANARRGGFHGTVTGASLVAHDAPIIYPPEGLREAA